MQKNIMFPVVAVAIAEQKSRVVLYVSGAAEKNARQFTLDSPTAKTMPIFFQEHLPSALKFACANLAAPLAAPVPILVAAMEHGICETAEPACTAEKTNTAQSPRRAVFQALFAASGSTGIAPETLSVSALMPASQAPAGADAKALASPFLRLCAIQRMTGQAVADTVAATVLGIVGQPAVQARNYRQGIVVVGVEAHSLWAALVYQDRIFGIFERPLPEKTDLPGLLHELESFRLGWLPPELAAVSGGWACVCPGLPPEAEGFKPLYATGERAFLLQEHGKIVHTGAHDVPAACEGLVRLYTMQQ